jgi:hypothetical protein
MQQHLHLHHRFWQASQYAGGVILQRGATPKQHQVVAGKLGLLQHPA